MNYQSITTKSGKTYQDFQIPELMLQKDPDIAEMILRSESMEDEERQYWFTLYSSMEAPHRERLRGILTKERDRRAEIEAKYGAPKPTLTPQEQAQKSEAFAEGRTEKWAEIKAEEEKHEEVDKAKEEDILAELNSL